MIPIGAEIIRFDPFLNGTLKVYKFNKNLYVMYDSGKAQESDRLEHSAYKMFAVKMLESRDSILLDRFKKKE